jgi:hypothetical protein
MKHGLSSAVAAGIDAAAAKCSVTAARARHAQWCLCGVNLLVTCCFPGNLEACYDQRLLYAILTLGVGAGRDSGQVLGVFLVKYMGLHVIKLDMHCIVLVALKQLLAGWWWCLTSGTV